jgi:hypothetical protein
VIVQQRVTSCALHRHLEELVIVAIEFTILSEEWRAFDQGSAVSALLLPQTHLFPRLNQLTVGFNRSNFNQIRSTLDSTHIAWQCAELALLVTVGLAAGDGANHGGMRSNAISQENNGNILPCPWAALFHRALTKLSESATL